jgi:seryl-tRNA synthetase
VDLLTFVFRHEPSDDPARMQCFRQREFVRLGTPDAAVAHRDEWIRRALEMHRSVGLDVRTVLANDPFFGRGGRVMKATQREQNLKYELVVPITSEEKPTAITSSNCHLDHFGLAFDIRTADGNVAHSACVGFGLERIALALFKTHGMDPDAWPREVRSVLEL